jgi:hypothetical protein
MVALVPAPCQNMSPILGDISMIFNHMRLVRVAANAVRRQLSGAACATVTRGSNDAWASNTDPAGAKGRDVHRPQCPATPCAIKMSRKIQLHRDHHQGGLPARFRDRLAQDVEWRRRRRGRVTCCSAAGVIGLGVDMATGASQDLHARTRLNLKLETPWKGSGDRWRRRPADQAKPAVD